MSQRRSVRSSKPRLTQVRTEPPPLIMQSEPGFGTAEIVAKQFRQSPTGLFGSPPKVNTFAPRAKHETPTKSTRSQASAMNRQLMGLNISMQDEMRKASKRAEDTRRSKTAAAIAIRRGLAHESNEPK